MITFKQYLTEQDIHEATKIIKHWDINKTDAKIDVDTAISLLNTHSKNWKKAISNYNCILYRGFATKPTEGDFLIMDSSTGIRTSKDTDNLYQLMYSTSTKMKNLSDRSKSLICVAGSIDTAKLYGHPYVIVPFNGIKITVSEHRDFLNTPIYTSIYEGSVGTMQEDISNFLISTGVKQIDKKFISADEINNYLEKFSPENLIVRWDIFVRYRDSLEFTNKEIGKMYDDFNLFKHATLSPSEVKIIEKMEQEIIARRCKIYSSELSRVYRLFKSTKNERFTALSSTIMTPTSLHLKNRYYGSEDFTVGNECWFSGKCMVISLPLFAQIIDKIEEQGYDVDPTIVNDIKQEIKQDDQS
jgi:hypothetical protein